MESRAWKTMFKQTRFSEKLNEKEMAENLNTRNNIKRKTKDEKQRNQHLKDVNFLYYFRSKANQGE